MVKMQAVQSAMAIRRQRSRREDAKKAKDRRGSACTPRPSLVSMDGQVYFNEERENRKLLGQVTMFHVGLVFIVIGLMLTITALLPGYARSTSQAKRSDLLGTGCFFVFLGGVITTISRFVSNSEEQELNDYIQGRLAKSKSGHRLFRDAEGGYHTPPQHRRVKSHTNGVGHNGTTNSPDTPRKHRKAQETKQIKFEEIPLEEAGSSKGPSSISENDITPDGTMLNSASTDPVLSRILEEDEIELEYETTEPMDTTPESSLTPTSPMETQGLLEKLHSPRKGSKSSSKGSCKSSRLSLSVV